MRSVRGCIWTRWALVDSLVAAGRLEASGLIDADGSVAARPRRSEGASESSAAIAPLASHCHILLPLT